MLFGLTTRRRIALLICPELRLEIKEPQPTDDGNQNIIAALLALIDAFQEETALSDWEIPVRAGVNNRAIKILRGGSPVSPKTTARLFEFFEETWPKTVPWPLDHATTARFGTVLTIPLIERLGGPDAMLALIVESGRKRTKDAVLSWARRSGMPAYARSLARNECLRRGVPVLQADFEPTRLTPAQITHLRTSSPKSKEAA